jgi:hypothetical protein
VMLHRTTLVSLGRLTRCPQRGQRERGQALDSISALSGQVSAISSEDPWDSGELEGSFSRGSPLRDDRPDGRSTASENLVSTRKLQGAGAKRGPARRRGATAVWRRDGGRGDPPEHRLRWGDRLVQARVARPRDEVRVAGVSLP